MTTRLIVTAFLLTTASSALAQLACGDVVGKGQKVTLTADVGPCDGGGQDAAIFVDGGTLDLGGRTVTCADLDTSGDTAQGIGLLGKKSKVTNGSVVGCQNGIFLAGDGKHLVQGVTVQGSLDDGVDSNEDAHKNKIYDSTFVQSGSDGIAIYSDKNKIARNTLSQNLGDGIDVDGGSDKNKLIENTATQNESSGIEVGGSKNKIVGCTANDNADAGFDLGGSKNLVRGGSAQGNAGYDVTDCTGNKVKQLSFTTASPDCQ